MMLLITPAGAEKVGQRPGGLGLPEDIEPVQRNKGIEAHKQGGAGHNGDGQLGKLPPVVAAEDFRVPIRALGGGRTRRNRVNRGGSGLRIFARNGFGGGRGRDGTTAAPAVRPVMRTICQSRMEAMHTARRQRPPCRSCRNSPRSP